MGRVLNTFSLLLILGLVHASGSLFALTYYSRVNGGNWNDPNTWSTDAINQCNGAAAIGTPGASDDVFICLGYTVIFNVAANTTVANLTIRGTLTISANRNLTCNSLALYGVLNGGGNRDVRFGNAAGSTLTGTGSCSLTGANLTALSNVSIPNSTDYITFNGSVSGKGGFDITNITVTNNGRVDILNPVDLVTTATSNFINNSSSSYLLYTRQANFPNILTATAAGNTVEFGSAAGGPFTIGSATTYSNLIITGAAVKRLVAGTTSVTRHLTINNGATLDVNNNNINISGDWINNLGGTFLEGTRTVTFNGSANNQTIYPPAGATGETFYNLTINNTFPGGTVTASGNVTITAGRLLTLTSGVLDIGTNTLGETAVGAQYTATGGELRLAKLGVVLPELTGTYTLTGGSTTFNGSGDQTVRGGVSYHDLNINTSGGTGTKTLNGNTVINGNIIIAAGLFDVSGSNYSLTVSGNWTNAGTFVSRAGLVTFAGTATQTINNTAGETFYAVVLNASGPLTLGASTDVMVTNSLGLTTGNVDLNTRTLTLGNGSGATLTRTTGTMYLGTFRRYVPAGAVSSSVAPLYGLFPMGIATAYRPIELNSTVNPTVAGYVSATHSDGANKLDLSPAYSDAGTLMNRIHLMQSTLATSGGFAGGTYDISVSFSNIVNAGSTADQRLLIYTGGTTASAVGTHLATTGTVDAPIGHRTGLTATDLSNTFVIGSSDEINTPLGPDFFYSRMSGNWETPATWSTDAVLQCAGPAAVTTPRSTDNVIICGGTTVTYDATSTTTIKDLTVQASGVLDISANQWLNCNNLLLDGIITGAGSKDLRIGNSGGSTLSGTGTFSLANANLSLLTSVTVPNATDLLTFNNVGKLDLNGNSLINNGRVEILDPSEFFGGGAFVNNSSTAYLKYTASGNVPNVITATAAGNTVEFGASAGGPYSIGNATTYHHLVISGAAAKRLVSSITVGGNLTIGNLATLDANGRDIILLGDWVNNLGGSFLAGIRNVTFAGSANNQNLFAPAGGETFGDLTINNTFAGGTVTSTGNVTISVGRSMVMTSGTFDMGANTLGQSGVANFTATGGDLRLAKTGVTLPELTGTYNVTGGTITFNGAGSQTIRSLNASPSCYHHIVLGGSGNKTLAGSIQVRGDYTNSGATLVPVTHTVTFNGTGIQNIAVPAGETFYNVVSNTTGPLTLASGTNATVTNQLTLTSGLINLNGQTLTLGSSGVSSTLSRTASSTTNWLYGGTFKRFWLAATTVSSTAAPLYGLFPLGASSGSSYRPLEINSTVNPTGGGFFTGQHVNATNVVTLSPPYSDAGTDIVAVNRAQFITSISGVTGGTYNISATMTGLSDGTLSDIRLAIFTGGTTASAVGTHAAATGTAQNPTARRTGITTLTDFNNDFRIATTNLSATPLPVELVGFDAYYEEGRVIIRWGTETEWNSDYFTVQRTVNGERFEEVAVLPAAGNSTSERTYQAIDASPTSGTSYYRLKQTDFDGTFTYSKLVSVTVPEFLNRVPYPNPTEGTSFSLRFGKGDLGMPVSVHVQDINGSSLLEQHIPALSYTHVQVSWTHRIAPGIYMVTVRVGAEVNRQKLVVR